MKRSLCSQNILNVLRSKPKFSASLRMSAIKAKSLEVGFSLGRRFGSAVARNKFKRKVRVVVRSFQKNKKPLHVLVQPKTKIQNIKFLSNEIVGLLSRFHAPHNTENSVE